MFNFLSFVVALCFIAHVGLLIAALFGKQYSSVKYFYSHFTLWLTGIVFFFMALLYRGEQKSVVFDYFDSNLKLVMILVATLLLSATAHMIVRALVPASRQLKKSF